MMIFCTGMARSGSVWSYNVCRLIISENRNGPAPLIVGAINGGRNADKFISEHPEALQRDCLLKFHDPKELALEMISSNSVKNIFTYRDPRDCLCSLMPFEGRSFDDAMYFVNSNLEVYDFCFEYSDTLFIQFEKMMSSPVSQIARIAQHLERPLLKPALERISKETSLENARKIIRGLVGKNTDQIMEFVGPTGVTRLVDRTTLLNTGHASSSSTGRWLKELSPEQQRKAICAFKPWLIKLGYETESTVDNLLSSLPQPKHLPQRLFSRVRSYAVNLLIRFSVSEIFMSQRIRKLRLISKRFK